jgi:two-component system, response regulator YesN
MNNTLFLKVRRNSIFVKFFLSLFCISAISVIIMAVSMFHVFSNKTDEYIDNINQLALSNISNAMSNYVEYANKLALQLFKNPEITSLRYSYDDDFMKEYNISLQFDSAMVANPYIYSIYICGRNRFEVLKANDFIPVNFKKSILNILNESKPLTPTH